MKKLGIALGGGSLRGAAHIGVLQVLLENGIQPQFIAGTSAGGVIAACYAGGVSPYDLEKVALKLTRRDYLDYNWQGLARYLLRKVTGRRARLPEGFIKGDRLERLVYKLTGGKWLQDVRLPLAIMATDLASGRKVIFTNSPFEIEGAQVIIIRDALLSAAVRASIGIPVTFIPRCVSGLQLVDGGLKDIVPVQVLKIMGADYVLGVDLQAGKFERPVNDIPTIIARSIDIMVQETSLLDEQLFADYVIFPEVKNAGLGDPAVIPACIRAGRKAMKETIEKVRKDMGL